MENARKEVEDARKEKEELETAKKFKNQTQ